MSTSKNSYVPTVELDEKPCNPLSPERLANMWAAAADLPGTWPWMVRGLIDDYFERLKIEAGMAKTIRSYLKRYDKEEPTSDERTKALYQLREKMRFAVGD